MANIKTDPVIRFWNKVLKTNTCWQWRAGTFSNGYGQFFDGKNKIGAHRYSYELAHGVVNKLLKICHTCDNRRCVNPQHLFLGTQKDNMQDMIKKNRKVNADTSGSKNGRVILNEELVIQIRYLYDLGSSIAYISRNFKLSETQISRIVKRQSWKHI